METVKQIPEEPPKEELVPTEIVHYQPTEEDLIEQRIQQIEDLLKIRGGHTDPGIIAYNGHDRSPGKFYGGAENPLTNATQYRLNYDGRLYATQMHAKAFFYTSDVRDKEDVKPLTGALDKLSQIQGVSFKWKDGGADAGVIAQQVQEMIPEAVVMEYESGKLSVNAAALIGYLVAAVRELKAEVEALKGGAK